MIMWGGSGGISAVITPLQSKPASEQRNVFMIYILVFKMQDNIIYYLKTVSKDTNGKTIFFFAK